MFSSTARPAICLAITLACVACGKTDVDAAKKTDGSESFSFKPDAAAPTVAASVPKAPATADDGSGSFHFDPNKADPSVAGSSSKGAKTKDGFDLDTKKGAMGSSNGSRSN